MAVALLMVGLQLNAQGIIINKTNGTKVYYPADQVESVSTYGYDDNPELTPDNLGNAPVGVEAVDLGLPSGTKWANMNIGATAQNEYGLFFAWGETVGYKSSDTNDGHLFNWANYKWMTESMSSWKWINKYQFEDNETDGCWYDTNYKFIGDGKTTLDPEDDAAHANWGGDWYMPTSKEYSELRSNTTRQWTTLKGVYGCKYTSKINGNAIFLPAAGERIESSIHSQGNTCYYWTSSLDSPSYRAYGLRLTKDDLNSSVGGPRYDGFSIRPVLRK